MPVPQHRACAIAWLTKYNQPCVMESPAVVKVRVTGWTTNLLDQEALR